MNTFLIFVGIGTVTHWIMRALDKLEGTDIEKLLKEYNII